MPEESMLLCNTEMQDELRRPMMLIISARKKINSIQYFLVQEVFKVKKKLVIVN